MIRTFKHRGLKAFHERSDSKLLNQQLVKRIKRILDLFDVAESVEAIDFPGYDLHELKGSRKGTWSVKVSGNWRITLDSKAEMLMTSIWRTITNAIYAG